LAFATPNALKREVADALPAWLPHKQVSLGLDLQGGSYLLIEVKVEDAIRERLNSLIDSIRDALTPRGGRIGYTGLQRIQNGATVTIRNEADVSRARELLRSATQGFDFESDGRRFVIRPTEQMTREWRSAVVEQSLEIIRRRIDELGLREPDIQRQGQDRILVQLPGVGNPQEIKDIIGKTAKMTFHLLDESASQQDVAGGRVPPGTVLMPSDSEIGPDGKPVMYPVRTRVMVSGETLVDAQPTIEQGRPVVSFRFDSLGARRFGDATRRNVGKPFAIVLDNKVISAPVIREPILGGNGIISGNFTTESARHLSLLLRSGALPVPLTFVEERTVGPGLGADSIRAGAIACIIGLVAVVVFMGLVYGLFGVFANIALFVNLASILALLSVLQATLTLPGIAGIVLTIGMAVDANVLIFERIREEPRAGRTPISAMDAGYQRAFSTIIDANLTTLIAGILLYIFGSGPVRGFAVTLSIGIVTSMFSAIMLTRLMTVHWLRRMKPKVLPI
jgi:preprotein translocase subunit SecD